MGGGGGDGWGRGREAVIRVWIKETAGGDEDVRVSGGGSGGGGT